MLWCHNFKMLEIPSTLSREKLQDILLVLKNCWILAHLLFYSSSLFQGKKKKTKRSEDQVGSGPVMTGKRSQLQSRCVLRATL